MVMVGLTKCTKPIARTMLNEMAFWKAELNFVTALMSVTPMPTVLIVLAVTHVNAMVIEQVMVGHLQSMKNVKT